MQPGNAHPRADRNIRHARAPLLDHAHDLMAGDDVRSSLREFTFHDMQIRPANAAGPYADQNFIGVRDGAGNLPPIERIGFNRCWRTKNASLHSPSLAPVEKPGVNRGAAVSGRFPEFGGVQSAEPYPQRLISPEHQRLDRRWRAAEDAPICA